MAAKANGKDPSFGPITAEEIDSYVERALRLHLRRFGTTIPTEQKDEIRQEARLRVLEVLTRLREKDGWRTFIAAHCRGAVLDYLRRGAGFEEARWNDRRPEGAAKTYRADSAPLLADTDTDTRGIRWELVSRMASVDEDLHLVAKLLLGFTQQELADQTGVSRTRISQRRRAFFERLDSPALYYSDWVQQTIYALGLCEEFHMPDHDRGVGWDLEPIDLTDPESLITSRISEERT